MTGLSGGKKVLVMSVVVTIVFSPLICTAKNK